MGPALDNLTSSSSYPKDSAVITATIRNNGPHALIGGYPWNYAWSTFFYTGGDCFGTPDQSRAFTGTLSPNATLQRSFTVYGPHQGDMDINIALDGNDSLPHWFTWQDCNNPPLNLVWTVDLAGTFQIWDGTSASWQPLKNFEFDIVKMSGGIPIVLLPSVVTRATGDFDCTIQAGTYDIYFSLSTAQSRFPVRRVQSPNNFFFGMRHTRMTATQDHGGVDFLLTDTTTVNNTSLYPALRIMRDMEMTDSVLAPYSPFGIGVLNNGVLAYMDSLDGSSSFYGTSGSQPIIIMDQSDVPEQIACHELGHHAMYVLQNSHDLPNPFDSSQHSSDYLTDSVFAFKEGFADFIRCISMHPPDAYVHQGQTVETNSWWRGRQPGYPGDSVDCGEIVEGSVMSILYDLYDAASRPSSRTSQEDDYVAVDSMLQYIFACIIDYSVPQSNQTRSLPLLAERLLRDSTARWYNLPEFQAARSAICDVFGAYHYHVPYDFCQGSSAADTTVHAGLGTKFETDAERTEAVRSQSRLAQAYSCTHTQDTASISMGLGHNRTGDTIAINR